MTIVLHYRKDKQTVSVKIQHLMDKKLVKIAYCEPRHWNKDLKMITAKHPDFEWLYPHLMDLMTRAKLILRDNPKSVDKVKGLLFAQQNDNKSFMHWIKNYLDHKKQVLNRYEAAGDLMERNRTAGHIKHYNDVYKKLLAYYDDVLISDFTRDFVKDLQRKLFDDVRLRDATAARYLSRIKSLHTKMVQDLNLPRGDAWDVPITKVTVRAYQGRRKRIPDASLQALYNAYLSGNMQRSCALYLCLYELGGCDLVDFYYIKWRDIAGGYLTFERSKVRGSGITIMISWHVWQFIQRYGQRDDVYVFPWGKDVTSYKTWQRNATRDLYKACALLGVQTVAGNVVSFKTARHTFSSRAKECGVDGDLLRELMGHQRNDVDNYYKDLFPQVVRDNAHLKVIDF